MSDATLATSVGSSDLIQVLQGDSIVLATVSQLMAIPMALVTSLSATVVAQAQQIAALQATPDPCVQLSGTLTLANLQVGSMTVLVSVPGLLSTDRVSVEPTSDLPAGLIIAWAHPVSAGSLAVALEAALAVTARSAITLAVTALR